jgi:hypothetical protein
MMIVLHVCCADVAAAVVAMRFAALHSTVCYAFTQYVADSHTLTAAAAHCFVTALLCSRGAAFAKPK